MKKLELSYGDRIEILKVKIKKYQELEIEVETIERLRKEQKDLEAAQARAIGSLMSEVLESLADFRSYRELSVMSVRTYHEALYGLN